MTQVLKSSYSVQVTSAGTSVTAFDARGARLVYLQADSANTSDMQIVGTGCAAGLVLAAGDFAPVMWVDDLSHLSYKAGTTGDKINVLILT